MLPTMVPPRSSGGRLTADDWIDAGFAVLAEGGPTALRVDVRNFTANGATWLRAARLYRGQTTNFRTAGGGFAPVLTLRG